MARIVSATFPLAQGTVDRNVPQGAVILGVRLDGVQGRIFAIVPNPAAPVENRRIFVVPQNVDAAADPVQFTFIGIVTTVVCVDWFIFEKVVE